MENDQIEEMAINIIEKEILKYSQLKSGIKKGDKEISWDGYITVFDGKGRGKDNFEYNINVQVKGRYVKKLNKGNSKYPLEKSHLLNYQKQKTGTLLLVVDFIDIENYQIYYANLLPVDLKALIDGNKSRAKKPKVNINLKPIIESSPSSLKNICLNFVINSKRQIGIQIKDLDELKNVDKVEFKVILENENRENLDEYLLNNDVYNYAILDDQFKTEIALTKGDLVLIEREINKEIKIKDKVYFNSYKLSKQKGKEIIKIGKGIFFDLKNNKINFNFQGTLQERITDMNFFVDLISNRTLEINEVILDFPEYKKNKSETEKIINEYNDKIRDLKELNDKFITMNIKFEEDIDKLEQQDRKNLLLFKRIFCDKTIPENLNIKQFGLNFIKIGKCHIAILVQKDKEGKIKINNFFENLDNIITIVIVKNNEKPSIENRTSPYFMLEAENILKFSNFNSDVVFQSLKLIQNWEKQSDYINRFMLELLKAYDKNNKRKDILELAENINEDEI